MKVLVIEDKAQVVKDITFCLEVRYPRVEVIAVADGQKGIDMVEAELPDLVMVDSSLPRTDTIDLVAKIRQFSDVPLVILCDTESDLDRAKGLEAGADEYINKPFSPIGLLARVNALLRRTKGVGFTPDHPVSVGNGLTINLSTHEVFFSGNQVKLTRIEFELLSFMVRNEGKVLTNRALLEKVWGSEYVNDVGFVKKYVYRLRTKLERDARKPEIILNERGIGYKFVRHLLTIQALSFVFACFITDMAATLV